MIRDKKSSTPLFGALLSFAAAIIMIASYSNAFVRDANGHNSIHCGRHSLPAPKTTYSPPRQKFAFLSHNDRSQLLFGSSSRSSPDSSAKKTDSLNVNPSEEERAKRRRKKLKGSRIGGRLFNHKTKLQQRRREREHALIVDGGMLIVSVLACVWVGVVVHMLMVDFKWL